MSLECPCTIDNTRGERAENMGGGATNMPVLQCVCKPTGAAGAGAPGAAPAVPPVVSSNIGQSMLLASTAAPSQALLATGRGPPSTRPAAFL
ncbi:unnamed protein product [Prorocentrum cordatum]|nr:unnamed protein product [Polarella glacialis]